MKFLCDNCKAKYQIADDKVQGKTLRMKCRKCGHTIEIRALEGGASPSGGETMQVNALGEEHAAAIAAALGTANPAAPTTSPLEPAKAPAPRPAAGAAKPVGAPAAPRPTTGTGPAAPRPTTGAAPRPTTGTGPAAPRPTTGAAPRPTTGTGPAAPRPTTGTAGPAAPKPESALASAFKKSVDDAPPSQHAPGPQDAGSGAAPSADPPAEEWYAAIGDVPVGPIRLAELRAKYTQGNVTDDTLVWREGFEEWRPLITLADLHRLVKEEVSGASAPRGSLLPQGQTKSTSARPQGAARPTGPNAPIGGGGGGGGFAGSPRAPVVQPSRSNVIPFDRAAARKLDDEMEDMPTQIAAAPLLAPPPVAAATAPAAGSAAAGATHDDPFAPAVAAQAKADPFASDPFAPVAPGGAAKPADDPFAAPPVSGPVPAAAVATTRAQHAGLDDHPHRETMLDRVSQKTGVSKGVAGLAAAACLLLGVVIAVLVVGRKTVVQERIVEKQVAGPTVTVTVTVPGASVPPPVAASASETTAPKVAVKGGGGGTAAAPTASATGGGVKGLDLGPAGPDVPGGPGTSGGGGGGGEKLSGQQVETVVSSKRTSVRKTCYEPYSDKGSATAKIRLNINADGSISSVDLVSTTGDSAIGSCVQKLARGWRFPASGSGGTFDVPFFFGT